MANSSTPRVIGKAIAAALALATPLAGYYEGNRLIAYLDSVGIPTICYGHTEGVKLGQTMTQAQCDQLLQGELGEYAEAVDRLVIVYMPPSRHAALTSFAYNVGIGAFERSTLLRLLNAGQPAAACDQLMRWVKARGTQWPGLVKRRAAERELCREGIQ